MSMVVMMVPMPMGMRLHTARLRDQTQLMHELMVLILARILSSQQTITVEYRVRPRKEAQRLTFLGQP